MGPYVRRGMNTVLFFFGPSPPSVMESRRNKADQFVFQWVRRLPAPRSAMASTVLLELSEVPSTPRQNTPSALTTPTRRRAQSEEMTTPLTSRTIEFTTLRRERGRFRAAARQLQADERRTPSSTPIPVPRPTSFGLATVTYRVVKIRHTTQQL